MIDFFLLWSGKTWSMRSENLFLADEEFLGLFFQKEGILANANFLFINTYKFGQILGAGGIPKWTSLSMSFP